jgi:hypothetical protein
MVDLAAREVNLALEYSTFCHQFLQDGKRLVRKKPGNDGKNESIRR